jgi:hypothetical protein
MPAADRRAMRAPPAAQPGAILAGQESRAPWAAHHPGPAVGIVAGAGFAYLEKDEAVAIRGDGR